MSATIYGTISIDGRGLGHRVAHIDLDAASCATYLPINIDHEAPAIGRLRAVERSATGELVACGVVDGALGDALLEIAESDSLYFSGEWTGITDNLSSTLHRPHLVGAAVTRNPAEIGLRPLVVQRGDVARGLDRLGWPAAIQHLDVVEAAGRVHPHAPAATFRDLRRRPTLEILGRSTGRHMLLPNGQTAELEILSAGVITAVEGRRIPTR